MVKSGHIDQIQLDGGLLCLDFVNSVANRREKNPPDYLNSIGDLISWALRLDTISEKTARLLWRKAENNPREAKKFFTETIGFRENLYSVFFHLHQKQKIPVEQINNYNAMVAKCFQSLELKQTAEGFTEGWRMDIEDFMQLLAPVVNDSFEFLLTNPGDRLKECPSCGWLFYDSTKNGKRRWCSMKSCGSNAKALEWYHRNKVKAS